jgi:hypothetical protein
VQHPESGWCEFGLIRSSHEDPGPLDDLANYRRLRAESLQGTDELDRSLFRSALAPSSESKAASKDRDVTRRTQPRRRTDRCLEYDGLLHDRQTWRVRLVVYTGGTPRNTPVSVGSRTRRGKRGTGAIQATPQFCVRRSKGQKHAANSSPRCLKPREAAPRSPKRGLGG